MIGEHATDLLTKIKAITSNKFGTSVKRVGLAVGGKDIDPLINKSTRPCAWVIFVGDENLETDLAGGQCSPYLTLNFVVKIIIDYGTEANLISDQFPLLEEVINAVNGTAGPSSFKWLYSGQTLDEMTAERMVWDQRYSIRVIV